MKFIFHKFQSGSQAPRFAIVHVKLTASQLVLSTVDCDAAIMAL